jgi:ubiquinone/menaquinone biosynthesis C-methylase UbiE
MSAVQNDLFIPSTPDSISPEWLTDAFRHSGTIRQAKVVSISVNPVAADSGFVGQAARLQIEYDLQEPGAPATAFAKLSSAYPAVREKLRAVGLYETEAGFYRDVAVGQALPMRVPRPYASLYDSATSASILVIEDLGHARFCDHVAGCSPADARTVVRQLALMHAHFWEAPQLRTFKWLRSLSDDFESRSALYGAMLPQFEKRFAEFVAPTLLAAARRFADTQAEYYAQCSPGPHTLAHGDFRPDNFAFEGGAEEEGLIVFDWQLTRRSRGARDLAFFMSGSMPTAQRRDIEEELQQLYYETLSRHGVTEYSREDLARDFRSGLGAALIVLVNAGGMLDFSSDPGTILAREACERVGASLEDHQFAEYLEDIASHCIRSVSSLAVEKHETFSGGYARPTLQALLNRQVTREASFFIPYVRPGMHILDCGCGSGGISVSLARLVPQGRVVGVDVEDAQLEMGRQDARNRGLENVQFQHASVYDLPFEDSTFDAVLVHALLYHLGEPMKALQELWRVLKPGGLIGVRDADIDGDIYYPQGPDVDRFWKLAEQVMRHNGGDVRFGRRHRQMLREAGFIRIVASASSDSFGTLEMTTRFSKYWAEIFLVQHRELILTHGWATASELNTMRDALLAWGAGSDAFYSRCRCEAVGRKPNA